MTNDPYIKIMGIMAVNENWKKEQGEKIKDPCPLCILGDVPIVRFGLWTHRVKENDVKTFRNCNNPPKAKPWERSAWATEERLINDGWVIK